MRIALALVAVSALLAGCGSTKADPYERANVRLLAAVPVYPGSSGGKTVTSGSGDTEFGTRDLRLPAGANVSSVLGWYGRVLPGRGWHITGSSFGTLRAVRGHATLALGVRGRTLEIVANSRGA